MKKSNQEILAVVFDHDGTLLRTEHLQWQGWNVALQRLGIDKHITRAQYQRYCGNSGDMNARMIVRDFGIKDIPPDAILREKENYLHKHLSTQPLHWMPQARLALRFFKQRHIPIALATSSGRKEMMKKLRRLDAHLHFDKLLCRDDVKRRKPHPDIYREACKRLNILPKNAIAFEDTSIGVLSASRAGLRVIAIPTIYSSKQDFSKAWAKCKDFKSALARIKHLMEQ